MLVGYVSDENDCAIAGADIELESGDRSISVRSKASGAVYADLEPGCYQVAIACSGYGAKRSTVKVRTDIPVRFRLLSDGMTGFMWPKCVQAGETSEYCVHSTRNFRLDLWRYGWEKHHIRTLGWCGEHGAGAMKQITPDGDYSQSGVNWNRVGYTLEYQKHAVVAPERSGLYYLHARTDDGQVCNFPWIVSPRKPTSSIAVLFSTMTWNAYNSFGGRSNYFSQSGLPRTPAVNVRQDLDRYTDPDTWPYKSTAAPLSFQRPEPANTIPESDRITDPIAGRIQSAFAPGQWRLVGWLDREGLDYDLYSDTSLHFDRLDLDQYRVLVLDNHPEYWTPEMYQRVKQWVMERGGQLMYLGGCGLYAEAELPDEQTMLCRREGYFDMRKETPDQLLGINYTHGGFQTGAPYRVLQPDHWIFEGTGLSQGSLFGQNSVHLRCPGGASAHELDKIPVSSSFDLKPLAKGTNPDNQGAELVVFETASGGAVFSTGSLCWILSLVVDESVSAITRNVFMRFLRCRDESL